MPAPQKILDLIATFERNAEHYTSTGYKEAMVRQQFIDPFFDALGWDMENRQGHAPSYQDVIHEDVIKIGGATKAPDYSFGIGKERKFFVEAKRPAVKLKDDAEAAYQLRRYAWTKKLPLSILTNFHEFAVYDGRTKPNQNDKASVARVRYLTVAELPAQWDDIAAIFSKDAVLKGSFDKFADTAKRKRGTATVDAAFLAEIESWRVDLAKNLALRNPELSQRDLNYAVQVTIDRIIFLRMCEDRGIEEYGRLRELHGDTDIYDRLVELFRQADRRYNSGLFYFKKDADHVGDLPDTLTPGLSVDDKPLKEIIGSLYYPESPYEFSVLPAEILGQVYEQFLGKVIRLTAGHQAKVEDKPEVKKAGGVYYTPKYIVDYIVKHTVGRLLNPSASALTPSPLAGEGRGGGSASSSLVGPIPHPNPPPQGERGPEKQGRGLEKQGKGPENAGEPEGLTPKQAAKLRILDPACGSGSFLLGAYEYLLDWHRDWYEKHDPEKHPKAVHRTSAGWRLTTPEKKRILVNNIFGVDIDPQAVEVTKLSLLLKVLEGESQDSLQRHLFDHHERALPDLACNIKCGNSLIGPDFYNGHQLTMFDEEERYRINVFDWNDAFPGIMNGGGFDAVIGNPPYVRIHRIGHEESDYVFSHYSGPASKTDLSLVFLEKALSLISPVGLTGFICTSQWLATDYGRNLRRMLSDGRLREIVDFGSLPVFAKASTYPAIFVLAKNRAKSLRVRHARNVEDLNLESIEQLPWADIALDRLGESPWSFEALGLRRRLDELSLRWLPMREFGKAYIGTKSGMADVFVVSRSEARRLRFEIDLLIPYAYQGAEIGRFSVTKPDAMIIYPYAIGPEGRPKLIDESELKQKAPRIYAHLFSHKDALRKRRDSRRLYANGKDWYRHLRPGSFRYIRPTKLVVKGISKHCDVGILSRGTAFDGANCPAIIFEAARDHALHFFLGVLNSRLTTFFLRSVCPPKLSGYIRLSATCIGEMPVRLIDFSNAAERSRHDRVVKLVDRMLALHQQLAKAKSPPDQAALQAQIAATDWQIDRLVYDLYGLTEEEIRIVEEATDVPS